MLLAALAAGTACSSEIPAAASKPPVTLTIPMSTPPGSSRIFKTAKAEVRPMPTLVTANGTITPDVNRTIHVTSLGSGRVVELKTNWATR